MHLPGHPITNKAQVKIEVVDRQSVSSLLKCILLLMPMNVGDLAICILTLLLVELLDKDTHSESKTYDLIA